METLTRARASAIREATPIVATREAAHLEGQRRPASQKPGQAVALTAYIT